VLINVVLEVLARLEALAGQGPEVHADANLVSLNKVVVNEALVDILDRLKHYSLET